MRNKKNNIFAMIPARHGSTRLKLKNLALIDGKPMISDAFYEKEVIRNASLIAGKLVNGNIT